jgi:hypothetical protein
VAAQSGQQAGGVVPAAREIRGVGEILSDVAVGFVRRVTDRSGPSPLFTRPESPRAPRGAGDVVGSPDGFRPKSGRKRGTWGATGPNFAVRMEKTLAGGLLGGTSGDALILQLIALSPSLSFVVSFFSPQCSHIKLNSSSVFQR